MTTERKDTRLWGGRFERTPDALFDAFQRSFAFDSRLFRYEVAVDRAWAKAIQAVDIITAEELNRLLFALSDLEKRADSDPAWLGKAGEGAEDVHHFVERELVYKLGDLGHKLHTGRSRNELIATDFRLWVIDAASEVQRSVTALLNALLAQAKTNLGVPMAGMTHMQHAQPLLLSHFLLAHAEAFHRDMTRLQNAVGSADACPMGSGALAGNSFGIDRNAVAKELGFSRITANSLDAVGDRDFALDYLYSLTAIATHLSRLAEDFVLFASQEFGYVILPDEYSTGSSLMPQKKNPDAWELIRGKSGRITAALVGLLTTLKGLPTSYQRDLQEDKEALFGAHDQVADMLAVAAGAIHATRFNADRLRRVASNSALLATEAADYLVRKGVPFRQAHDLIGKVLREAEKSNVQWTALPLDALKEISPAFDSDLGASLTLDAALASKRVPGGTALDSVRVAIADLESRLSKKSISTGAKP